MKKTNQYLFMMAMIMVCHILVSQNTVMDGNVGIRNDNPERALHVLGTGGIDDDIVLQSTGTGAAQMNYWRSAGTLGGLLPLTAPGSRIGETAWRAWNGSTWKFAAQLQVNGNVLDGAPFATGEMKFRLSNTSGINDVLILESDGDIKVPDLGTPGVTRDLEVLPDGTIKAKSFILGEFGGVASLTAFDFVSGHNPGDDHNYNNALNIVYHESISSGFEELIAPLHLQQGSIIKRVDVIYYDNNPDTIRMGIFIQPKLSNMGTITLIGSTEGASTSLQVMSKPLLNITVNNFLNDYFIFAQNPADTTDWPGSDIGVKSVIIFYD